MSTSIRVSFSTCFAFQLLFPFDIVSLQWNYAIAVIAIILISQPRSPITVVPNKQTHKHFQHQHVHLFEQHMDWSCEQCKRFGNAPIVAFLLLSMF